MRELKLSPTEYPRTPGISRTSDASKDELARNLIEIEIVRGCSTRICTICSDSAPFGVRSMPFTVIQELHDLKTRNTSGRRGIRHHRAGEPFYYFDAHANKTYADVHIDAVEKGIQILYAPTHGWLPGEAVPIRAAHELVYWAKENQIPPFISFSIDPYGYVGIGSEVHRAGIAESIAVLKPVILGIQAFYVAQDPEGINTLNRLIESSVPPDVFDLIKTQALRMTGRMLKSFPQYKEAAEPYPFSTWGYAVRNDGSLIFEADYMDANNRQPMGNIYSHITEPLGAMISRAPDFDDWD